MKKNQTQEKGTKATKNTEPCPPSYVYPKLFFYNNKNLKLVSTRDI